MIYLLVDKRFPPFLYVVHGSGETRDGISPGSKVMSVSLHSSYRRTRTGCG